MSWTIWVLFGALFGGAGVAAGAFGAHALKSTFTAEQLHTFEVAVRYQMYHAIVLLFVGLFALRLDSLWVRLSGTSFVLGTLLFSGSLYLYLFYDLRQLMPVVPIGGGFLILGWVLLLLAVLLLSSV